MIGILHVLIWLCINTVKAKTVHELMHIFLVEMRMTACESDFHDHEERVAQTLACASTVTGTD